MRHKERTLLVSAERGALMDMSQANEGDLLHGGGLLNEGACRPDSSGTCCDLSDADVLWSYCSTALTNVRASSKADVLSELK
jgi:hypothetical protein